MLRGFQIAPEGAVFRATQHKYKTALRHLNCEEYYRRRAEAWTTALGRSDIPYPEDCSCTIPLEILSGYQQPGDREPHRWLEVCSGGCNGETTGEEKEDNDQDIANIIYCKAQALCKAEHLKGAEVVEIESARVAWSDRSPIPAYFSLIKRGIVAHSSAVTGGHLALIQVRGQVDTIEVDFRTHDYSHVNSGSRGRGKL